MTAGVGAERVGVGVAVASVAVLLGIGSPTPWTGVGFVVVWAVFWLAGKALLPAALGSGPAGEAALASGLGLTLAIAAWSLSAYARKSLWAGTAALVLCAAVGLARSLAARPLEPPRRELPRGALVAVVACSLALGLYLEGYNEIVRGDELLYSFRWDWEAHLFWASLVREQGLPLVGTAGAPEAPLERLLHTGLLCSLGGIEEMTRTTPYQAARILSTFSFALLGLSSLSLSETMGLSRGGMLLCSLAPLAWGSLSLPFDLGAAGWRGATDPYAAGAHPFTSPSGAMYHNLTQLESVALAAAALAAIPSGGAGSWTLAAILVSGAGLAKPTTFVVLAPALTLVALRHGASRRSIAGILAAFAAGVLLFALPMLVADVPAGVPSRFDLGGLRALASARTLVWLGVPGIVGALWIAGRAIPGGEANRTLAQVLGLACATGLAFSAAWSEPGRTSANDRWGLNAALVLMAPMTVAAVMNARGWLRHVGLGLLGFQLASGALYAGRYPWLQRHSLPVASRALLDRVRQGTQAGTRLFVDMGLLGRAGYPYLGRPTPLPVHLVQTAESYDGETWRLVNRGQLPPRPAEFLARRDGVVLGPWTRALRHELRGKGWRLVFTDEPAEAQLWLHDAGRGGANGPPSAEAKP